MPPDFAPTRPPVSPFRAYIEQSRRPFVGLIFTLPFFAIYHFGIWLMANGQTQWVNGADVFLRWFLHSFDITGSLVSMVFVMFSFIVLQHASKTPWRFRPRTLGLMGLESLALALPPFLLGKLVSVVMDLQWAGFSPPLAVWPSGILLSFGAGVYEEFLFRVILMGGLFWFFKVGVGWRGTRLYMAAVLTQAVLFALVHHLPTDGNPDSISTIATSVLLQQMAFRTLAGVYFAYIYQERGFGIAAGSHVLYDVIAVSLSAFR